MTAPTGIAASHIGGCTFHAATGIGIPVLYKDFFRMMGKKDEDGVPAAQKLEVLIIDEVSMMVRRPASGSVNSPRTRTHADRCRRHLPGGNVPQRDPTRTRWHPARRAAKCLTASMRCSG